MAKYAYAPHRRKHIAEQIDSFCGQWRSHQRHAGNVSARMRQAGNYASFDRVACYHHDWEIVCCLLCGQGRRGVERHDHIDVEPDQFGRELRKAIQLFFGGAKLEYNVLPLDIAKFTQPFPKIRLEGFRVCDSNIECTYSSYLRLLPARRHRPCGCGSADEGDELSSLHGLPSPRPHPTTFSTDQGGGKRRSVTAFSHIDVPTTRHRLGMVGTCTRSTTSCLTL